MGRAALNSDLVLKSNRDNIRSQITLFVVMACTLLGLGWKWSFFRFADATYETIVIRDSFFPAVLQSAMTLRVVYLGCLIAIVLSMLTIRMRRLRTLLVALALVASTTLMLHQGSYNDMTFVTSWWSLAFALWFSTRMEIDSPESLAVKASLLSRLLVSIVLLGGAVGKWTGEYWSGQVLYEIYFVERDFWFFNLLRARLDAEPLREFATGYSRVVIVVESLGGLIWLLPRRVAAVAGMGVFLGIGLISNYSLFSVLSPMIGLAAVGLLSTSAEKVRRNLT